MAYQLPAKSKYSAAAFFSYFNTDVIGFSREFLGSFWHHAQPASIFHSCMRRYRKAVYPLYHVGACIALEPALSSQCKKSKMAPQ
jgi:hypothetical protein